MKILVACEYSGIVRDAFIAKGHQAVSCDILPTESPGPHYQGDVLDILYCGWDMLIAHPPCTYLTYAGAHYWTDPERALKRDEALDFFRKLAEAPIPKIAIENPRGWPCQAYKPAHQEVNPFDFGEPERKRICLWLKGLGPLFSTYVVPAPAKGLCVKKNGKNYRYYYHQGKNGKRRSKFFPSVAKAMADQWG